ncbi:rod shape-determining protein [Spiroplasma endosymbiont of Dilophus febrilis]|uniref:rod shape-determining protein n=1 Tax=Spiroplasma endosymbiont of Dilophus febrilis TaxID=3066292 RepID=UPI00313D5651
MNILSFKGKRQKPKYISIDLGTANTLIYISGEGIVYNEPSIIAYNINRNEIIAVGEAARKMVGKGNKNIRVIKPMTNGVISDVKATEAQLQYIFMNLKILNRINDAALLLACPSAVTDLEKKALKQIGHNLGAKKVFIEEEVKMAAIGGGVNINSPHGQLIIDMGGGTTDIAVIASGDIVLSKSIKIAGNYFNNEIQKYVRTQYGIEIGSTTAENIKIKIGSLTQYDDENNFKIYGRHYVNGRPQAAILKPEEIRQVLQQAMLPVIEVITQTLEITPAELSGDIYKNGITICGGGALLKGTDKYITEKLELPTKIGEYPLLAVINGTKKFETDIFEQIQNSY